MIHEILIDASRIALGIGAVLVVVSLLAQRFMVG